MTQKQSDSSLTPALSVAMSVFNGARFLAPAIESVLAQSFGDFEFLILDDGSSDATPDMLRDYARQDSRVRPIIRENRGLIASLNQLLDEARAPIIARMDDDDISLPSRFAKQMAFLAAHPDHGVVGCWAEDIDVLGNRLPATGGEHPVTHEDFLANVESGGPLMAHPGVMYRRDIVRSVGGYHAAFKHCEDYDLWLRLAGVTHLANIPERLLRYRRCPDQVSRKYATEQSIGSEIAHLAYRERKEGRPDPTLGIDRLPSLDEIDSLFRREGVGREVRELVAENLRYSHEAMRSEGFDLILRFIAEGGKRDGMWRTVARLLRFGEPIRALRLAAALTGS